jgi:hypothetical protein
MKILSYEQADKLAMMANSYSRLELVLSLTMNMEPDDWLRLLGEQWECCDNISEYLEELRDLIGEFDPCWPMMTDEEQERYRELPEEVAIYRGCGPDNVRGACWTLNRSTAETFPILNRYRVAKPLLVTARVKKADIVAVKLGREEDEIITFFPRIVSKRKLKKAAA